MAAPGQSVRVRRALPDGEVTAVMGVVPLDPGSLLRAQDLVSLCRLLPHTVRVRPLVPGTPDPFLREGSFFLGNVQEGQVVTVEGVDIPRRDGADEDDRAYSNIENLVLQSACCNRGCS